MLHIHFLALLSFVIRAHLFVRFFRKLEDSILY